MGAAASKIYPHLNFPISTNDDPTGYPHVSLRSIGGSGSWEVGLVTEPSSGSASNYGRFVDTQGRMVINEFSGSAGVTIEPYGTAFTVNANSAYAMTITSVHPYYQTYFLHLIDYRSTNTWFVHVKDLQINSVVLDFCNTSSSAMTIQKNEIKIAWLLIRDNSRT